MNLKDNRTKNLNIRISEDRLLEIKKKAKEENMTLADFVIAKCLNLQTEEKVIVKEKKKKVIK
ncbi:MAG: hypothetical protein ABRQ39_04250 [Candidatus Eremiobacterota bacterium]